MDLGLGAAKVLVTGASSGIGREAALGFAREGARVVITYQSRKEAAEAVLAEIAAAGSEAYAVPLDLREAGSVRDAVATAVEWLGGLDVLVGNAVHWGAADFHDRPTRIEDAKAEQWLPVLRANLEGNFHLVQQAAPSLRESRQGRVVLVSTDLVERGLAGSWAYGAAKAGLHGLVAGLQHDLGADGVLVNVVMPGITVENGSHRVIPQAALEHLGQQFTARRLPEAADVAAAIMFLCSARTTATQGEILRVNGGSPLVA
ncbi:short-chain dehydrogenase/reductase SDR [Kribbella flavida DSM 17836]|uniref:Short-chain dehydrogenase/reductase SDR n=1 Tax=Kribbella flavida (strain DSM 17836 / JCM 10339 / NBRC 14399) TaxID=479435 RepID=D2PNP6_KRIFD|nr:SDR family oxidoreductase [Kribbella flavida]ADB30898.1 short-chain dehydrogenase/reductase SDR [Kribbella flavida DSM 17836]